jgi:hypothetical protein
VLDRFLDALTGRRLGGALFVLAGIVVVIAVLNAHDGGDDAPRKGAVQRARIVSVPQLGLTFAYPATWSRDVSGTVIRLRAPRSAAAMTFASPVEGRHDKQVKAATLEALRGRYAPAKVLRDGPAKLGPRTVASVELQGSGSRGEVVRALALVGSSDFRTYVVTLITPGRPSARTLAQAQQVLATVRVVRPGSTKSRGAQPEVPSKG